MLTETTFFDRRGVAHPQEGGRSDLPALLRRARRRGGFLWLEAWAPDAAEMADLAALLGLDRGSAAEASAGGQQPKILRFDGHLTVVAWTVEFRTSRPRVAVGEVFLFVARNALLTVRRPSQSDTKPARSPLAELDTPVSGGALGAAFLVLADLCAEYTGLTDQIESELGELEEQVYDDTVVESRPRIYRLRQQIGKIGRAASSLAAALESSRDHLSKASVGGRAVEPYLRDLLDDLSGTAAVLRDQSSTLDAVVASHENNAASRQNDDTRKISAIAALISVPALTAGVFGMNFDDLPFVKVPFGWVYVLAAALLVDVVALVVFRRRGWL
ncbi:MAG TPA: CorA family divalent cation transporter [Cellulomonas sp.]